MVADALHLSAKGDLVTKRREDVKVYKEKKKNYTYEDLHDPRVELLCRLYNQFLHVCTKRPQKTQLLHTPLQQPSPGLCGTIDLERSTMPNISILKL